MRIAWFTPRSTHGAVAEFSRRVTAVLAAHADVDVWTAEDEMLGESGPLEARMAIEVPTQAALRAYDAVFYNMANDLPHHGAIHELSKRHPGIVILHDRVFQQMFVDKWLPQGRSPDPAYGSRMTAYYGEDGARVARESLSGVRRPVWECDEELVNYPLVEEVLQRALGAVTQSEDHAREIRSRWLGPVAVLPYPSSHGPRADGATLDLYALGLIEFVAQVQRTAPALALLDRVADELATMRADPSLPVFDTIANDFGRALEL